jgi:hypothetical protein
MSITAFVDRLGDAINPIAVKEMRQAVKGRILVWMLILFLLAQLVIMGVGILINEFDGGDFNAGPALLSVLLISLLLVCLLFLPAIFGLRLSSERSQNRMDLLFITDMSPYSIIWGKTLAGIALTGLLFSTSMPFLTLTYLLRGIDLPSIFVMLGLEFCIVILTIQGALLLACFPGGIISRGIRFLFGLGGAIFIFSMVSSASFALLEEGIGSLLGSWEFWGPALTVLGFILLTMGFLYVLSATLISPASSNQAPVLRLYLFFVWCSSAACASLWYMSVKDGDIIEMWMVCMMLLFIGVFIISMTERSTYGPRVRRQIPRSVGLRIPLFVLYSGSAGGVLFSLVMLGLTLGGIYAIRPVIPSVIGSLSDNFQMNVLAICLYMVCYGLTALFLRRLFGERASGRLNTVMIMFILLAFGSLFPFLFAWFFVYHDLDRIPDMWYLGNPLMVLMESRMLGMVLQFVTIWGLVALSLNVPWFASQIRQFKPLDASEDSMAEAAAGAEA